MSQPSIVVVCGGPSVEAEVSRVSGTCVAEALRATFNTVSIAELGPDIAEVLRASGADVVFPALHGPPGEDGAFQGLLEILGMPYVGSGVLASACAMNKVVAKDIFRSAGLPVARQQTTERGEDARDAAARIIEALGPSVVVKPSGQGSALGVIFAEGIDELAGAIGQAGAFDERLLIEERIVGREITVAVLERERPEALPVVEIETPTDSWYDYEHRYTPGLSRHLIPAPVDAARYELLREIAVAAHVALGCRDLSRADFVLPAAGDPVLLEVNTLPGMTPTSLFPDAARAAGISFEELVAHLARRAHARGATYPAKEQR
jgi:D-alanine-D-alanine ligase